jgi:hypothetical protein
MIDVLSQKLFAPCEPREVTIQRKFERITQWAFTNHPDWH